VAAAALKTTPGKTPKRKPPVSVASVAPGSEKATMTT